MRRDPPGSAASGSLRTRKTEGTSPGRLFVRRLPDHAGRDRTLSLLLKDPTPATPEQLAVFRLTPRETEILFWIAQGKTSPDIAGILDTASTSVKHHVYHIPGKRGVETRLAAALKATETLGLPTG